MSPGESVFASAADARYGFHVINLIGSLQASSDIFDRIVVYDLGMSDHQRAWLGAAPAVEIRDVPPFVPHWNRGFTWKPWAWTHVGGDAVVWVDAGATVLRSLAPMLDGVRENGFFLVSQREPVSDIVPDTYFERYGLAGVDRSRPYAAAGIIGFRPGSDFYERVIVPTYDDCVRGLNLGFSAGEVEVKNIGLQQGPVDTIHDCRYFRWDQSILNVHLLRELPDAPLADPDRFGGWRSPHDHPEQVIWHHRRRGSLRYAKRLRVRGPERARWYAAGLRLEARWWSKLHVEPLKVRARLALRRRLGR